MSSFENRLEHEAKENSIQNVENKSSTKEAESLDKWQFKNLPFMQGMIIALALFFCIVSVYQLDRLQTFIQSPPSFEDLNVMEDIEIEDGDDIAEMQYEAVRAKAQLEALVISRRYHQANISMLLRSWIRSLGFITGMIISLVGSAFILGKIREKESQIEAKNPHIELSLQSSSPGIILVALGVFLMIATIVVIPETAVTDVAVYLSP